MVWLVGGVGVLLVVIGIVLQRRLRGELDTTVRVGGYTVEQVKSIRRDVFAGRLPADIELKSVALAIAGQAAHNIPVQLRFLPLIYAGAALMFASTALAPSPNLPPTFGIVAGTIMAGFGTYIVVAGLRALRNSHALLDANNTERPRTE